MDEIIALVNHYKNRLKLFTGRATRKEFWTSIIANFILLGVILGICSMFSSKFESSIPYVLALIAIIIISITSIAVTVRRLHDLGLSGFWIWYLNPAGLPIIFVVYLLGLDKSVDNIFDRIKNLGSIWLGWILTLIFWSVGAPAAMFLLCLYAGKNEENEYGPSPYNN